MVSPVVTAPKIVLLDFGETGILQAELQQLALALLGQVNTQFALPPPFGHGLQVASVRVGSAPTLPQIVGGKKLDGPQPDEWAMIFMAKPDIPGAYGYHDRTPSGQPVLKCFPLLDKRDGHPWQVTASHELLETLKDPELSLCAQGPDGNIWAYEVCDAVEADSYLVNNVPVSNFNTPCYFEPPEDMTGKKYDWLGKLNGPVPAMTAGGYGQYFDPENGWQQKLGDRRPRQYRLENLGRGIHRIAKHKRVIG